MAPYLWITLGSALGGLLRYVISRLTVTANDAFPWGTLLINIIGCFVIGFFGTFTCAGSRYQAPENVRLFVMVGLCGGFTTFSSFSLENFELLRGGYSMRALGNIGLSVVLCLGAVAVGHWMAQRTVPAVGIVQGQEEEFTG